MTTTDRANLCERLRAALEGVTPGPWFAGPLQPEDEYGAPGGVSIGPFDLAERYGSRPDYTPDTFNSHYESTIIEAWGGDYDAEANATFIALSREAVPSLLDTLERQAAEIERLNATCYLDSFMASERKVERQAAEIERLRDLLVQADLTIRSFPGADQGHVEFIRAALTGEDA